MKLFSTVLLSLIISISAMAGNDSKKKSDAASEKKEAEISIVGHVSDEKSKETLAGATIYIDGKKVYSDLDGEFVLPVTKPGKYQIKVELISYETTELEVEIRDKKDLFINLSQK